MRQKLVKARSDKGLTQAEMAVKLGVTRACYSNYENGIRTPPLKRIIQIKKILGNESDEIFLNDFDTLSV